MNFLSAAQLSQFEHDGFLVIKNFLSRDEITRVKADISRASDKVKNAERDFPGFNFERADGGSMADSEEIKPGVLRKIQGAVQFVPEVEKVFSGDKMLDCMEDLMGPNIYYHSSKVMFKPPGGAPKPWHQDAAYWREFEPKQITAWIAIDDASVENGCVWAIPGSHKLGLIPHVKRELQVEESRIDLQQAVPVPVAAGGLLIFHSLVLHMSERNNSEQTRWAIICDYDCLPNPAIDIYNNEFLIGKDGQGDKVWALRKENSGIL